QFRDPAVPCVRSAHLGVHPIDPTVQPVRGLAQGDRTDEVRRSVEETDEESRLGDPPRVEADGDAASEGQPLHHRSDEDRDRKSARLNSSHVSISYGVIWLMERI